MDSERPTPLSLVGHGTDVRFYAGRAGRHGGPALVLGCAHGSIAWELSARGIKVLAVDPSPAMLRAAEERRLSEPLDVAARVRFLRADLRSLRLPERFPLVLAPQNAPGLMGSMNELEALFATARHHLSEGGLFVFDILNPAGPTGRANPVEMAGPHAVAERLRPGFFPHLRERKRGEKERSHGAIRRLRLHPFWSDQVDSALAQTGLVALERYGNFEEKPFDRVDPVQVTVATLG